MSTWIRLSCHRLSYLYWLSHWLGHWLGHLPLVSIATPLPPSRSHFLHLSYVYIEALEPPFNRQSPQSFLTIGARTSDWHLGCPILRRWAYSTDSASLSRSSVSSWSWPWPRLRASSKSLRDFAYSSRWSLGSVPSNMQVSLGGTVQLSRNVNVQQHYGRAS